MNKNIPQKIGKFKIEFSAEGLTTHSGMLLLSEFAKKIKVKEILDNTITLKKRKRGYSEGEAILGLCSNIIIGGECLDDLNGIRGNKETLDILGLEEVIAPTTAGEYLRKFMPGHILQFEKAIRDIQENIRPYQDLSKVTLDMDSSIYSQASDKKQGSNMAYNGDIGYHPLVCFIDETGEMVHSHFRSGNAYTSKNAIPFLHKVLKRLKDKTENILLRADSGFYFKEFVEKLKQEGIRYGITADQTERIMKEVNGLKDDAWREMPSRPQAEVAEFFYTPCGWAESYRYIVKRENIYTERRQLALDFKQYKYHILVTNRDDKDIVSIMAWHLKHANMENRIKEHKLGFSLEKLPTQCFLANWAYFLIGQLSYNLVIWLKTLILPEDYKVATIKTIRHRFFYLAGKMVKTGRQFILKVAKGYAYKQDFLYAVNKLFCFAPG